MSSPRNSAPASPMMIRAGLKLCGRNPTQIADGDHGDERRDVRALEQPGLEQPVGVEEERGAGDEHDARREPVEAVDEVDRVGEHDDHDAR